MKTSIKRERAIRKLLESYDTHTIHIDSNGKQGYIIMNNLDKIYFDSILSDTSENIKIQFSCDWNQVLKNMHNSIVIIK